MKNSTLIIKQMLFVFVLLFTIIASFGQTTLSAGDIAITGFNSDNPDSFSFVLLTDITATTEIKFTDNGWESSGSFYPNEGIVSWTTNEDMQCGTEIIIFKSVVTNPFRASLGDVVAIPTTFPFALATNGDQILAYQGDELTPTFIYALNFDSTGWSDATTANTTALPTGLTDGVNAINVGESDNGNYICAVNNDASAILVAVSTIGNWSLSSTALSTLGACQYFCSSDTADWCNLQFPPSSTISFGDAYNVFGQIFELGITDTAASQGAGITAWIGFSTTDATSTVDFASANWTWIPTIYNPACGPNCGTPENNDEYYADLGAAIPGPGTYYYATRFQLNSGPYIYGGYNAGGGGFWDGSTNESQILTVNSSCASTVTWNGSSWIPASGPGITTDVIITGMYDMTGLPSFSACSLTIDPGASLIIDDLKYVEVNNDIINNGNLTVRSYGSVLQNSDSATMSGNDALVIKTTATLNNWYEYTYWSSPVSNETIGNGLFGSDTDRRFWFDAINFVDAMAETNNDNNLVAGQDDIDDDANDWRYASATDVMTPGVGYAATHNDVGFVAGNSYNYNFNGILNNGIITVPVYRNDTEVNDINWNFIGNPYPSAIDVDLFFDENNYNASTNPNGTIDGVVYLWSQNTAPADVNNGNEGQNFSNSDYAIINGIGVIPAEDPGGDGLTPNRYIPSGQGFFTAFSNVRPSNTGTVEFNNSMRVADNNNQFFRITNSSQSNKISVKLASDNGVFNQLLVGYVDGATNGFDGMYYDAPRNLSTGSAAIIYSSIEGNTRKFAIQGKNPNSLNLNEIIPLGIKNTIAVDTQFSLSIANLEGDFMTGNNIYLNDKMLDVYHNLSESDYSFTSEVGEFNDRFEIRFASTLSINEYDLQTNELLVFNNESNSLEISTSQQSEISTLKIYDLLGRLIQDLEVNNISISINASILSNSVYIVKATLENGQVFTKKILK